MRVTDSVCHMTIDSEQAPVREVWKGKTYYFCSIMSGAIPCNP